MSNRNLRGSLAIFTAFLVVQCGTALAKENTADVGTMISCPSEITGFRLNYNAKYTPPAGWGHADANARAKKGGVHSDLTLVVNGHAVKARSLVCQYGVSAIETDLKLASIKKVVPKGTSCTAVSDFRFSCTTETN